MQDYNLILRVRKLIKRPNVLILFTDQQRYDTIAAAGYKHMITPNLDRLVNEGTTYLRAYSTNPVCMPARHDMLTGLPAGAHGYFVNSNKPIKDYGLPTIPRIFSEAGYRTAAIGKCHFYPARMHHGFSELYLMEELPECRQDDQYAVYLKEEGLEDIQNIHGVRPQIYHLPQHAQMDDAHHGSSWVADKVVDWIDNNGSHPFFLFAGWISPHPPWQLPEEYHNLYSERDIPEPIPNVRDFPYEQESNQWFGDLDSSEEKRKIREAYYASVTHVDKNIGRILDYLEDEGLLDNTLIIFTSDHGEMLQDRGLYSKQCPYESAARIPLIVRYPDKFKTGKIANEFVDLFDIMPTCLDVCGLSYNGEYELPGESLSSTHSSRDRDYQISANGLRVMRWVMCRNDRYKYIYRYNGGREEMYDLKEDPGETENLVTQVLMKNNKPTVSLVNEFRSRVLYYEIKWGPEGYADQDGLKQFEAVKYQLPQWKSNTKFPGWSNKQFQFFDKRDGQERAEIFEKERDYAMVNRFNERDKPFDYNNDNEWKELFEENYNKYKKD